MNVCRYMQESLDFNCLPPSRHSMPASFGCICMGLVFHLSSFDRNICLMKEL